MSWTRSAPRRTATRTLKILPARRNLVAANFRSALDALSTNRTRSLLTMLGVIIGVAAVIAAISLTQGVSALITARINGLGTNAVLISPGAATTKGASGGTGTQQSLTIGDAAALGELPHVVAVSPVLSVPTQMVYQNRNWNTRVSGVYPAFQGIQNWQLAEGAWFSATDQASGTPVVVLGQTVASNLIPSSVDPVGQRILINNQLFRVVGVLQSKGAAGAANQDDVAFVPYSAAHVRLDNSLYVSQIVVQAESADTVTTVQTEATTLLRQRHNIRPGQPDDFQVRVPSQLVQTAQVFASTLSALLIGIAAISLVVGGIGIMNIMLVSVTERTREIGTRMAVGARRSDIRDQFLIEAFTLSATGGVLGIVLGLALGFGLQAAFRLPLGVSPLAILLAVGVAAAIGVGFGYYPAVRASRLDPIVALRTE